MSIAIESGDVDRRGQKIYDEVLKPILEPTHNGEVVAIHVDTGDYVVARNGTAARRLLREKHSKGSTYSLYVGPVTVKESSLANHLRLAHK